MIKYEDLIYIGVPYEKVPWIVIDSSPEEINDCLLKELIWIKDVENTLDCKLLSISGRKAIFRSNNNG